MKNKLEPSAKVKTKTKTKVSARRIVEADVKDEAESFDVQEDEKYLQYRRIVRVIRKSIDLKVLMIEVKRMHSGRISRLMYGTNPGPQKLSDAVQQDSSYRSRMAEIRSEASSQLSALDASVSEIRKHLMQAYGSELSGLRTKGERVDFVDQYLASGLLLSQQFTDFVSQVDFLIKDIDQSSFSFRNLVKLLEIIYSKNNDRKL